MTTEKHFGKLGIHVENLQPILCVKDINASLAFYRDILGFENAAWGTEEFTSINRENAGIYLCKGAQGQPGTWLWLGFDGDIFQLHETLKANGVTIKMAPSNFSWAMEMQVEDPDGHVIRFGTEPDDTKPFLDKTFTAGK
ncbi:MAG: VOC family protein [Chitinophagaceae bacterium]